MNKKASSLRTAIPLLLICAVCALLVAWVNGITESRIVENENKQIEETILEILPEAAELSREDVTTSSATVRNFYRYRRGDETVAYAAITAPKGFRQEIVLCTVLSAEGTILGVRVLSASETPGLGDRACTAEYLDSYSGLEHPLSFGEGIDVISGATISSRAILDSVQEVLEIADTQEGGSL